MEPAAETGRRLALLVATAAYTDPDLRQLRTPGHDAGQLAAVLRDPRIGGFDVQVLINPASAEVQEGIEDFCADRHPADQLLIYLSCHGVLDSYGRLYYAAANTRRQRLAATAVAAAWLNERLEDCRARRQILILDCCHSGAFAKGAKGDSGLALQQRFEPHGRGRVVLTASRSTEYSFEGGQASGEGVPSVFTRAIVDGLRTGDADRDKDGLITVTDLYQYVYGSVRAAEPRQTPELWTYGAEGNLLIARSVRGAVIEPEPLPEDLHMTLESPRRRVRETAVAELADLLDTARPGLALTARRALEQIAEQDHPQVATLAHIAVAAPAGEAAGQVRRELTSRAHQEDQARQEAARREAEQRQAEEQARREAEEQARREAEEQARREAEERSRQVGQLKERIRERAGARDWDAVLATSGELAALDPAAADPDGLASIAREQIDRRQQAGSTPVGARQRTDGGQTELGKSPRQTTWPEAAPPVDTSARSGARQVAASEGGHLVSVQATPTAKTAPLTALRDRFGGAMLDAGFIILAAVLTLSALDALISQLFFSSWPWWLIFIACIIGIAVTLGGVRQHTVHASILLWAMSWFLIYSITVAVSYSLTYSLTTALRIITVLRVEDIIGAVVSVALCIWLVVLLSKRIRKVDLFLVIFLGLFSVGLVLSAIAEGTDRGRYWYAFGVVTLAIALVPPLVPIRARRQAVAPGPRST
jgi:hypothetical protein